MRYNLNKIGKSRLESFLCVPSPPRACIGPFMAKWPARSTRPPPTIRAGPGRAGHLWRPQTYTGCGTSTSASTARPMAAPSADSRSSRRHMLDRSRRDDRLYERAGKLT